MGAILVGTAGWADQSLIKSKKFYPPGMQSPEARLRYYSEHFGLVEVDSSFYALPEQRTAGAWALRTPDRFIFDLKAYALLTKHPAKADRLPKDLQALIPASQRGANFYMHHLPPDLQDEIWARFREALRPIYSAGKLGLVLFQFPPWFVYHPENREYLLACQERLPEYPLAIEFRHGSWLDERHREGTLAFLAEHGLTYVSVDEPQGFKDSLPPLAEATSRFGYVRFHGRNREAWKKRGITAAERFNYLYTESELKEWEPQLKELQSRTDSLHVIFNNCYENKAVVNAASLAEMFGVQAG